jgi:dihydrodipicolinate synthase/N-acetylneuraminate lyase
LTKAGFPGVNLAIATPFTETGEIDFARFEALIDTYLEAGVHGFVLGSGTGMHVYLTEAARLPVSRTALDGLRGHDD